MREPGLPWSEELPVPAPVPEEAAAEASFSVEVEVVVAQNCFDDEAVDYPVSRLEQQSQCLFFQRRRYVHSCPGRGPRP